MVVCEVTKTYLNEIIFCSTLHKNWHPSSSSKGKMTISIWIFNRCCYALFRSTIVFKCAISDNEGVVAVKFSQKRWILIKWKFSPSVRKLHVNATTSTCNICRSEAFIVTITFKSGVRYLHTTYVIHIYSYPRTVDYPATLDDNVLAVYKKDSRVKLNVSI